ncbi:MAG: methyltransferase domain-containing protein [Bacteroidota bacterium]
MIDLRTTVDIPRCWSKMVEDSEGLDFQMNSDLQLGSLLKTLVSAKASPSVLELGTGVGLALSWMVEGLAADGSITSIDHDPALIAVARSYFAGDPRVDIICEDAEGWITSNQEARFDIIFADTWAGKYLLLEETLQMLKPNGIYIVDDMRPADTWPDGHEAKAEHLINCLEQRNDLNVTKLEWSTGIVIATKMELRS